MIIGKYFKRTIAAFSLMVIFAVDWVQHDTSLDSLQTVTSSLANQVPGQIKIGIVGDSWASGEKLDGSIRDVMMANGLNVQVVSSGHPGAKSRQIYRNLFTGESVEHSSRSVFLDDLDYLVVVAGVNDSASNSGSAFYAHHVSLIVQASLDRGIRPVVVELPEYGIELIQAISSLSAVKAFAYRRLFDEGEVNVIESYRSALRETIAELGIADKVLIVDFSPVADDYSASKHLYSNPSHLTAAGYQKLGRHIAGVLLSMSIPP